MSKASEIENAVHELLDVVSGTRAHLTAARADELHEAITPGYNDEPLSAEEEAQLAALKERQDREAAKAKPKGKAKDDDGDDDGDAG